MLPQHLVHICLPEQRDVGRPALDTLARKVGLGTDVISKPLHGHLARSGGCKQEAATALTLHCDAAGMYKTLRCTKKAHP